MSDISLAELEARLALPGKTPASGSTTPSAARSPATEASPE